MADQEPKPSRCPVCGREPEVQVLTTTRGQGLASIECRQSPVGSASHHIQSLARSIDEAHRRWEAVCKGPDHG